MAEYRRKGSASSISAPAQPARSASTALPSSSSFSLFGFGGSPRQPSPAKLKVKNDELMVFFRQLAVILQTGVPLSQGLELLAENITNPQFAYAVSQISGRLNAGQDLSNALCVYPKVFQPITIGLIRAGEFGGILDAVVDRTDHRRHDLPGYCSFHSDHRWTGHADRHRSPFR
jgi:type IV pilus assembly protein PilC